MDSNKIYNLIKYYYILPIILPVIFLQSFLSIASDDFEQNVEPPYSISSSTWSPKGNLLVVNGKTKTDVWGVWFYDKNFELAYFYPTEDSVSIYWSPDGTRIAVGRSILDSTTFQVITTLNAVSGIGGWETDGTQVLAFSEENKLGLFDAENGQLIRVVDLGETSPDAVSWSPYGKYFIRLLPTGVGEIISAEDGHLITTINMEYPIGLRWSPDSRYLAAGFITLLEEGTPNTLPNAVSPTMASVVVWEAISGNVVQTFTGLQAAPSVLRWHPHRPELAVATASGLIYIWDVETREENSFMSLPALTGIDYSPFGERILVGSWTARQYLYSSVPSLSDREAVLTQNIIPEALEVIVPVVSVERLNSSIALCVERSDTRIASVGKLSPRNPSSSELKTFVGQIESLPANALPEGCADDLLALAAALQTELIETFEKRDG